MMISGFDPGGNGSFGCAVLDSQTNRFESFCAKSVDEAFDWLYRRTTKNHVACGIDTYLHWQTTPSGWRGADEFLKSKYPSVVKSIFSSNSAYGAMAVQGAIIATKIRNLWPNLILTETHPKILYYHLAKSQYPTAKNGSATWAHKASKFETILNQLNLLGTVRSDDEFDAVLSAWAAKQAYDGKWQLDLCNKTAAKQKAGNFYFVEPVNYFWPHDHVH